MNIFFLDEDPRIAARFNCDAHVVKIPTEICQMFQCGFSLSDLSRDGCPKTKSGKTRGHFNPKHPVTKWALQSKDNWEWARSHAIELIQEKRRRFPQTSLDPNKNLQICLDFIDWCDRNMDRVTFLSQEVAPKPKCISIGSKARKICDENPNMTTVEAYRLFYKLDKPFAKWRLGNIPVWFN